MTRRTEQINGVIKVEISDLLKRQVKDPRIGDLVTVTSVITSADLRHARIFISIMGSEDEKKQTMKCLKDASGFLRKKLSERLTIRYTPELIFQQDDSIEHGAYVLQMIDQISAEHNQDNKE